MSAIIECNIRYADESTGAINTSLVWLDRDIQQQERNRRNLARMNSRYRRDDGGVINAN